MLLEANRTKTVPGRLKLLGHLRPRQLVPDIPRNAEPRTGLSMGEHQALTTERMGIPREAQDELAVASHQRLAAAYERGFFDDLVTPYLGLERDQNLRPDSSAEKLAQAQAGVRRGTMTAANSTPLSDGAAVVLLATDEWAKQRNAARARAPHVRRDRGGRLHPRRGRPADGAGLRRAAAARARRA